MKTTWMAWAAVAMTAAAMMPLGCSSVEVEPQPQGCPAAAPKDGETCSVAASGCAYSVGPCAVEMSCGAKGAAWTSKTTSCSPAAANCWSAQEGDSCADVGESCGEADGPCGSGFTSTCSADHLWHVESVTGGCPPHPQPDECQSSGNQTVCEATPGCRWLTPGCDPGIGGITGCFAAADCATDSCGSGEYCQELSYNPCFDKECDACAAPASVCLAIDL